MAEMFDHNAAITEGLYRHCEIHLKEMITHTHTWDTSDLFSPYWKALIIVAYWFCYFFPTSFELNIGFQDYLLLQS